MNQDELKQLVGTKAVEWIKDGMIVGLGTGSTVKYMVDALGKRVNEEGLNIVGVTTSIRTAEQAKSLGIVIKDIDEVDHIDLTIDGADEISSDFQGIKGGGAALLYEKIVATKMVDDLGQFPLPVEVIPYGSGTVFKRFEEKGLNPEFRKNEDGSLLHTDSDNYIIDLHLGKIENPKELGDYLINQVGVVEHGLFLDIVNTVIVGRQDGPEVLEAR